MTLLEKHEVCLTDLIQERGVQAISDSWRLRLEEKIVDMRAAIALLAAKQ